MEKLKEYLNKMGFASDDDTLQKYARYMELILEWNEKVNLTSVKDPEEFEKKHLIDSLTAASFPQFSGSKKILDVGTGAGLPGIPLAIAAPDKQFLLMDSIDKKLKIVQGIAHELGLTNVKTLHARAEDPARTTLYREKFDLVLSRAVANMSTLSEYCVPYVKIGGWFGAYKTEAATEDINDAKNAIETLGATIREISPDRIEGSGHLLIWIEKTGSTPKQYPRKAGVPAKDPMK